MSKINLGFNEVQAEQLELLNEVLLSFKGQACSNWTFKREGNNHAN